MWNRAQHVELSTTCGIVHINSIALSLVLVPLQRSTNNLCRGQGSKNVFLVLFFLWEPITRVHLVPYGAVSYVLLLNSQ